MTFLTQLLNGLSLGSIYALVALGYTMVYGIILLLNFAHGDIIMVGGYIAWITMANLGLPPFVAALLAVVGCMALGVLIDKVAYAPLRDAPRLSILITAIGVSYFLENGGQLVFGAAAKVVPSFGDFGSFQIGDASLSGRAILTVLVTAAATAVLTFLVQKTKLGKAMRAVSEDMGAARLMGISVNHTISFTFAVGSALAGNRRRPLLHGLYADHPDHGHPCSVPRPSSPRSWEASARFPAPSSAASSSASPRCSSPPSGFPFGRTPWCSFCSSSF